MAKNTSNRPFGRRALTGAGRLAYKAVQGVTSIIDWVFHRVADKAMDKHLNKQERLAMQVPEYADIEARRKIDGHPYIVMASEEDGLGLAEWERQDTIRHEVKPTPWWFSVARFFRNAPLTSGLGSARFATQRVARGWDDKSLWSLDDHLCTTLGAQLTRLADVTHGWPEGDKYPEFEDWQAALRKHGAALSAYSTRWDIIIDDSLTPEGRRKKEDKIVADAKRALRWVAENLQALWD